MNLIDIAARAALAAPFLLLGYDSAKEPGGRVIAAKAVGIPEEYADPAVRLNGAAMVLGGLAVATGIAPRIGAATVAATLIPTTIAGHAFWKDEDPAARMGNRIQFLKNLGLLGGMLAVVAGRQGR